MELTKAVDRILWIEWGPLGVYNEADFMSDEYESYVSAVVELLEEGRGATDIANHLAAVAHESMDLTDAKPDLRVVELLIESRLRISDG
jgi:hypothetical protein